MTGDHATERRGPTTDPRSIARDALARLARIASRCGLTADEIVQAVQVAVSELPAPPSVQPASLDAELPAAPHILTVWHDDPAYSNGQGRPRALSRVGPAPSFETLVHRVDAALDPDVVLPYLMRAGAVKRERRRYIAVSKVVLLRGVEGAWDARTIRGVDAMLRTAEHNSQPASEAPGWLERTVENHHFPISQLGDFQQFLDRETMSFLTTLDRYMRSAEIERQPNEPTLELGVGAYRFQEEIEGATIRIESPHSRTAPSPRTRGRRRR